MGLPSPSDLVADGHSAASPAVPARTQAGNTPAHGSSPTAGTTRAATTATATAAVSTAAAPIDTELAEPTAPVAPPGVTADGKIIINTASASELERLPGVGTKRAAAIIKLRIRLKKFRRPTDLLRVRGIGVRTLRKMLPLLVVNPPPPPAKTTPPE